MGERYLITIMAKQFRKALTLVDVIVDASECEKTHSFILTLLCRDEANNPHSHILQLIKFETVAPCIAYHQIITRE